jgi:hypothetical protein
MSRFLTDKYLKYMAALRGRPVERDTECESCGYNLRGLRYGSVCPECGTPIQYRRDPHLAFHEMPLPLIKSFRLSCWMLILAFAGLVGFFVTGGLAAGGRVGGLLMIAVAGLWVLAAWRLTQPLDLPQAVRHGFAPRDRLRIAARWLQFGWLAAVGGLIVSRAQAALGGPARLFTFLPLVGVVFGVVGIGVLAIFLSRFAQWLQNEFAAKAFTVAVWGTALATPLVLLLPVISVTIGTLTFLVIPGIVVLIGLLLVISIGAFPVGLLSLSRSIDWSVVHAEQRMERDRQMHERLAPRPPARPAPTGDIELAEPPRPEARKRP